MDIKEKLKDLKDDVRDSEKDLKSSIEEFEEAKQWMWKRKVYLAEAIIALNNFTKVNKLT